MKRRRKFTLTNAYNYPVAKGILYDEGNVQILWRNDIGWTAEQYASIATILDLVPDIVHLKFEKQTDLK